MFEKENVMNRKKLICASAVMAAAAMLAFPTYAEEPKEFKVGLCNYVDAPTQNRVVSFFQMRLIEKGFDYGVRFNVDYRNCNADEASLNQIIADFEAENVDVMVGITSTVVHAMQEATVGTQIPVVFAAVADPISSGFVQSLDVPGGNLTGTSDYLDTNTVFSLILAQNPGTKKVGILDDLEQEDYETALVNAKAFCDAHGIDFLEVTVSNAEEAAMAVPFMAEQGVDAIFTPTDSTLMSSEYEIYQTFIDAGVPHYGGADGFAVNGAFVGYGVDYGELGIETADMVVDILINGNSPATMPVRVLPSNTATINDETCKALGYDVEAVKAAFVPVCTQVKEVLTEEDFSDFTEFMGALFYD